MKLLSAFSPSMLTHFPSNVTFVEIGESSAAQLASERGIESFVGHQGAAMIYEVKLGIPVPVNRVGVRLEDRETALLGQYMGPRLPEGKIMTVEEMAEVPIQWLLVKVAYGQAYEGNVEDDEDFGWPAP